MRVGIPIWNGRVSPVLDTAERIVVVDTDTGTPETRTEEAIEEGALPLRAARLAGLGLDLLVCGAVSRPLAELLGASGVRLEAWVSGDLEDVLSAVRTGRLDRPRYRMPGCGRRQGRGRGRGRSYRGRMDARRSER